MMNCFGFENEAALQEWCREEFGLTYGQLAALVATVTGFRLYGLPMSRGAIESIVVAVDGRTADHGLHSLSRLGFVEQAGKGGESRRVTLWLPTNRGIRLVLGPLVAERKSGPGLVAAPNETTEEPEAVVA